MFILSSNIFTYVLQYSWLISTIENKILASKKQLNSRTIKALKSNKTNITFIIEILSIFLLMYSKYDYWFSNMTYIHLIIILSFFQICICFIVVAKKCFFLPGSTICLAFHLKLGSVTNKETGKRATALS